MTSFAIPFKPRNDGFEARTEVKSLSCQELVTNIPAEKLKQITDALEVSTNALLSDYRITIR